MLANATESALDVDVALVGASGGAPLATRRVPLGPLGFAQLNVANDLGVDGVSAAAFVLSTPTTGGAFAAYASAIDRATGDPRTLLPR
jgi:acetyl-CoA carboxylase beta subunit